MLLYQAMKVKLKEIESFPAELGLTAQPKELDLEIADLKISSEVDVNITIHQTETEYFVNGKCSAQAEMDCARCLEPASVELSGDISLVVVRSTTDESGDFENDEESIRLGVHETLSLDDSIRQALFSEVPLKPLCQENCKGLCAACGANKNEKKSCDCDTESSDSRWDALRNGAGS